MDVQLSVIKLLTFCNLPEIIPAFRSLAIRGALPTRSSFGSDGGDLPNQRQRPRKIPVGRIGSQPRSCADERVAELSSTTDSWR